MKKGPGIKLQLSRNAQEIAKSSSRCYAIKQKPGKSLSV
jgi:hypothetical protein